MRTYRELFRTPEFTPLFLTSSVQGAASTVTGLALGTLVYAATRSPLLSALIMFGPSLAQLIGATALLSAADRLAPRAAIAGIALAFALGTFGQAIPGLAVWTIFAIAAGLGAIASLGGGVRFGLLNEILPAGGYLLGRSVLNMSVGIMQICGFAVGGVLVATLSPRGALLAGAAAYLAAAAIARFGLSRRPPRAAGRPSIAQTWRNNAQLWSSVPRRYVYLALWVPNGLIVGCESLFVPYAPRHAGLLFASAALGMLVGDTLTGRFVPARWRERLSAPLRMLLAAPYLVFAVPAGAADRGDGRRARLGRVFGEPAAAAPPDGTDTGRTERARPRTAVLGHARRAGRGCRHRGRGGRADLARGGDGRDGSDFRRRHSGTCPRAAPGPHAAGDR